MIGISTDSSAGILRVRLVGELTLRGLTDLLNGYRAPAERACLVVLSAVSATALHFGDMSALAQLCQARDVPGNDVLLVLVAPDPVTYGICRMYQGLRDDLSERLAVVSSEAEGYEWLRGPLDAVA
jgi:hypothetical protein